MPVDTSKVTRRPLRFSSIDEAIAEARRITALAQSGKIQYLGNWDASQILNHLAGWAEHAFTPNPVHAPWLIKLLVRPLKNRFLNKGLPSGRHIPKIPEGTTHTEKGPVDQALARFEKAFTNLQTEIPTQPSPVFGRMTQEEYIKLNLRHAELHMGFIKN